MTKTQKVIIGLCVMGLIAAPLMFSPKTAIALALTAGVAGTVLNESPRVSDSVFFEAFREIEYCRDSVTVASGTVASVIGQVLGKITIGAVSETHAGNTGNGAMTLDATTPAIANAQVGVYTATCTTAQTNAGIFTVTDPKGNVLGTHTVAGAAFANQIKFAIADGATDFVAGDKFLITVAAGSGKWTQVTPAAFDGTQYAAGILIGSPFGATLTADQIAAVVTRGPAIAKSGGLAWTSGMTTPQKTTALAQLTALGILQRTDYGV